MLKLDSIELHGFKSFADRTRLNFTDRITAIVGPNGCGKSNLSDALGWVLGAHAARNIRGQRMEDIIFSGTKKRKLSGFAEVKLRLKHTGEDPVIANGEEINNDFVEVSRRFYRSGEGHYKINNRRCRLMDIQEFLEDAGLGFASYAMIAQGRIDSFLAAKPLDRRTIIEEAAEIVGYKTRRRNAELKLEMSRQNLVRVNDIISEVDRQLRSLKRQAAKARRYRRLREEYKQRQKERLALEACRLRERLDELEKSHKELQAKESELGEVLTSLEKANRAGSLSRERLDSELSTLRQRQSEILLEMDRTKNSLHYEKERKAAKEEFLVQNSEEQQSLERGLANIDDEAKRFQREKELLEQELSRVRESQEARDREIEEYRQRVSSAEEKLDAVRKRILEDSARGSALEHRKEHAAQRLEAIAAEFLELEVRQARLAAGLDERRQTLETQQQLLAENEAHRRRLEEKQLEADSRQNQDRKNLREFRQQLTEVQNRLIGLKERLQSLEEVEACKSHYSEGVQRVLQHLAGRQNIQMSGTLADSIETSSEYEHLVEEFLDEELEYILVDSLDEAILGLSEMKALKTGKATFLTLNTSNGFGQNGKRDGNGHGFVQIKSEEGVYGRLRDLVKMKEDVERAFVRVLPQQADAVVVSDMDRALQLAHQYPERTFITLAGESLAPKGLVSATSTTAGKLGLLSLKRQKKELTRKIRSTGKEKIAKEKQLNRIEAQLEERDRRSEEEQKRLYELEKEFIGLEHGIGRQQSELAREQEVAEEVSRKLERIGEEEQELRAYADEMESELAESDRARQADLALLEQSQEELQQLRVEQQRALEVANRMESDYKVMNERRSALEQTLKRISRQESDLTESLAGARRRREEVQQELSALKESIESRQRTLEETRKEREAIAFRLSEKEAELLRWKEKFGKAEEELEGLRRRKTELRERRSETEIEQARIDTQLENLEESAQDQVRVGLSEAIKGIEVSELDRQEIYSRHDQLKEKLDNFGPINMTALDEYQDLEERHSFLSRQRADIESSIADTTSAIQKINRRSQERFSKAFAAINSNFQEVFRKLFGGGECGMQLLDEEDILECGIDVYAQPPGKKLQNVMLLSGGEKALTVFALLIALFMYRPSRFCVLDEVDAPLDDANVKRFGQLVKEMSEQTQFIIITHNKRTMEMANALYGITMEEPGVSKIVSVEFSQ